MVMHFTYGRCIGKKRLNRTQDGGVGTEQMAPAMWRGLIPITKRVKSKCCLTVVEQTPTLSKFSFCGDLLHSRGGRNGVFSSWERATPAGCILPILPFALLLACS